MHIGKELKIIKYILIIALFACKGLAFGQTKDMNHQCITQFDSISNRTIYLFVDSMPEFPGGNDSLMKFIMNNVKWPNEIDFQGTVYISFIVEPDGNLSNKKIRKGVCGPADKEAMRVIDMMPKWKAGKCKGVVVPVEFIVPIKFKLY